MSSTYFYTQKVANLYLETYSVTATTTLLVYHWLLCLDQEVRFIWNWRSRFTIFSLMYALSRYPYLIQFILSIVSAYPMSDLSCTAISWAQIVTKILGIMAFSTFSALRTYTLLNRNMWFTATILFLALPPIAMHIVLSCYQRYMNKASPFNCSVSSSLSPVLQISFTSVLRGSQFLAELLMVGITWWYSYQSYHIRKGINLGETLSSLLIYNGSIYFLVLAILYISVIIWNAVLPGPGVAFDVMSIMGTFVDPIVSILVCHFMLLLRQFDSTGSTRSAPSFQWAREGTGARQAASTMLEFAAQPSDNLPAYLASFANPVHVSDSSFESDIISDTGEDEDEN